MTLDDGFPEKWLLSALERERTIWRSTDGTPLDLWFTFTCGTGHSFDNMDVLACGTWQTLAGIQVKMNSELWIFSFSEANLAEHQKRLKNWPKNSDRLVIYDSTLDDRDHAVRYRGMLIEVKRDPTSMWFCASFRPHKEWCLWCGMVRRTCDP